MKEETSGMKETIEKNIPKKEQKAQRMPRRKNTKIENNTKTQNTETRKRRSTKKSSESFEKDAKLSEKMEKGMIKGNISLEERRRMPRKPNTPKFEFKKENLKIIPLGGLDEIGKNITVFEYGNEIVLVDCGLEFPEDDMLGVDLVIPDIKYLEKKKEKIKGLVITHGHEDNIG